MTKTKATHQGHCQVCGRVQKLPNGVLSLHGYTVECNFFEGICTGAKALPFEQDISLVAGAIARAEAHVVSVLSEIARLRQPATEPVGWYHAYARVGGYRNFQYRWMRLPVQQSGEHEYPKFYVTHDDIYRFGSGKNDVTPTDSWSKNYSILEVATAMNSNYATTLEKTTLRRLQDYIAWQQNRIEGWKPSALIPIRGKKKAVAG